MKLRIEIKMDGAAFDGDNRNEEAARILRDVATAMEYGTALTAAGDRETLNDINGNIVGTAKLNTI